MKRLLLMVPLITGCVTGSSSGGGFFRKTVRAINPVNWFKGEEVPPTWLEVMAEQLAPFQWVGLACIMSGFIMAVFKLFDTKTGIAFMMLGFILSLWGIAAPRFVGLAIVCAGIVFACALVYFAYRLITGRRIKLKVPATSSERTPTVPQS